MKDFFKDLSKSTRDKAAEVYRQMMIESWGTGIAVNYQEINDAIINRWSVTALEYILNKAWHQKDARGRVFVIAKNTDLLYDVFYVSMKDVSQLIGFSTRREAIDTLIRYKPANEIAMSVHYSKKETPIPTETTLEVPPMGDNRWVFTGTEWELSRVTSAGTLIIPKHKDYGQPGFKFNDVLTTVCIAHGLDVTKVSSIKSWDKLVAIHF